MSNMYSPGSPVLSSLDQHAISGGQQKSQCLKFKYFTTLVICTTCIVLLSASMTTHKWIVSRPIRVLRLNGGQTNLTSLMLMAQNENEYEHKSSNQPGFGLLSALSSPMASGQSEPQVEQHPSSQNNKFQGEIYFGLFKGVKVLNYGFGDRVSQISVIQLNFNKDNNHQELVNFKLWLLTVAGISMGILFALVGSIFAIINFVMSPRGKLTGPVGLVVWNGAACISCLVAIISWLAQYLIWLRLNVLTAEEVQNGWTSENRSHFGYSFYFAILALVLHLVNIFIVSIVQFESWTNNKAAKRQSRVVCEGVIMLY